MIKASTWVHQLLCFHGLTDPHILETLACHEAQSLGRDLLLLKVAVAYDCLNVVKEINSGSCGVIAPIIKEIKDGTNDFQDISFAHENRLSNMEAHHLALCGSSNLLILLLFL